MASSVLAALDTLRCWKAEQHGALDQLESRLSVFSEPMEDDSDGGSKSASRSGRATTHSATLEASYAPLKDLLNQTIRAQEQHRQSIDRLLRSQVIVAVPNGVATSHIENLFAAAGSNDRVVVRHGTYSLGPSAALTLSNRGGSLQVLGTVIVAPTGAHVPRDAHGPNGTQFGEGEYDEGTAQSSSHSSCSSSNKDLIGRAVAAAAPAVVIESNGTTPTLFLDVALPPQPLATTTGAPLEYCCVELDDLLLRNRSSAGPVVLLQLSEAETFFSTRAAPCTAAAGSRSSSHSDAVVADIIVRRCHFESRQGAALSIVWKGRKDATTHQQHQQHHLSPHEERPQTVRIRFTDCVFRTNASAGDVVKIRCQNNNNRALGNASAPHLEVLFDRCSILAGSSSAAPNGVRLRSAVYMSYSSTTTTAALAAAVNTIRLQDCQIEGRFDHALLVELADPSSKPSTTAESTTTHTTTNTATASIVSVAIDGTFTFRSYRKSVVGMEVPASRHDAALLNINGQAVGGKEKSGWSGSCVVEEFVPQDERLFQCEKEDPNAVAFLFLEASPR